ncbi:hypothetical protein [Sutterella sp.]|uniref:hypothetical protein n=1 Tax=Sutterella sp. TaxID=1981025 RepID=UPI0026DEF27A|nr:hypothetical protein [Sutterella sp.]MDO5531443.1 hypothetical protein [Sutterella sp.]
MAIIQSPTIEATSSVFTDLADSLDTRSTAEKAAVGLAEIFGITDPTADQIKACADWVNAASVSFEAEKTQVRRDTRTPWIGISVLALVAGATLHWLYTLVF